MDTAPQLNCRVWSALGLMVQVRSEAPAAFEDSTLAAARMAGGFGPVFSTCGLLAFDKRQQACRGL